MNIARLSTCSFSCYGGSSTYSVVCITASRSKIAKENSSCFEVILYALYSFKKHINIFLVLSIGF
jgi:hypothetical protein